MENQSEVEAADRQIVTPEIVKAKSRARPQDRNGVSFCHRSLSAKQDDAVKLLVAVNRKVRLRVSNEQSGVLDAHKW